jgi:arabinose-5-phosphate isomerase
MGKSGHVGRKMAATLASTGTPAMFVHPAEASHGDLGMITSDDAVIALSQSGQSEEIHVILPTLKRLKIPLIAITGNADSHLARYADVTLSSAVAQEACPLNLAPTASTTVQIALGDALAVALLDARGFQAEDFARSHPGGSLGRKLLLRVGDLMRKGDELPIVSPDAPLSHILSVMSAKGMGFAVVVTDEQQMAGIFTDGDLRRLIEQAKNVDALRQYCARDIMHTTPKTIRENALAAQAAQLMEQHRVTSILVLNDADQLIGAINSNDLMRAKVI